MKTFAVFLRMADEEKSVRYRSDHLAFLEQMRTAGHVRANGRFPDGSGGLIIYQAESLADCAALADQDPYIRQGARNSEIHEWEAVWAD
ncbi:YciI family protein [Planococcus lenghuensis]|uniref:YCII-related domain-containing protein n=1 Tax=Planococcus lenghuensis TaxID=2213202 RepID=A0A1Q2L2B0_9BACL|nr:YciI family protein [Planococcus lenghuensis]AQQ54022.1 hypothetical protein B0X71_13560 [Planococcus lenghuensis]